LLEHKLRSIFASPTKAAFFLALNGLLLYGAELLRRRAPQVEADDDKRIARQVTWRGAFLVGAAQAVALIPGFSRSGASMGGGLIAGLSNEHAARFSFLLATPITALAVAYEGLKLVRGEVGGAEPIALAVGVVASFVAGILAIAVLLRYVRTNSFTIFVVYRFVLAAIVLATLVVRQ
jgi:undecaprenyl-diphosphatase